MITRSRGLLKTALEGLASVNGKVVDEIEKAYYIKLNNIDELKKASKIERFHQRSIRHNDVIMRVRKIEPILNSEIDRTKYELTIKKKLGTGEAKEYTENTTVELFDFFGTFAERDEIKDRHYFEVVGTNLVWEVDMFLKNDSAYRYWARAEIEIPSKGVSLPQLPDIYNEFVSMDDQETLQKMRDDGLIL
ncbi:MAG: hypothetical protein E6Q68_06895 [Polynucleobacter sp.]|nr:MAG: hypothetical protein E6Q68_06895 [Polynucleobacter sp.]